MDEMLVLSAATYLSDATAKGIVIEKDNGSGVGTHPITILDGDCALSTLLIEDYKTTDASYPFQDKIMIIIHQDNPVEEIQFDVQMVSNQSTWQPAPAVMEGEVEVTPEVTSAAALLIAHTDLSNWKKKSSVAYDLPDPATADPGQVLGVVDGAYAFVTPTTVPAVVVQEVALTASVNDITLPLAVTGDFLHQIFEVSGTQLIPQPNVQMYYDSADSLWHIDLTGAEAMTVKIYYLY